ncbi:MAG: hypothetical protein RQ756_07520 [Flavobacteriaceae bacterium]|nr:hypothetical protein [Flavobacteriaceae bacterium]
MKTFKRIGQTLLVALLVISCSNFSSEETKSLDPLNSELPQLSTYLDKKYPQGFTFGFERKFEDENETYIAREVIAKGQTEVSGMVIETNNKFTQYLELDRVQKKLLVDDFIDQELYAFDVSNSDLENIFDPKFLESIVLQNTF